MVDAIPTNVTVVDDRSGNHFWIFSVFHTTGTDTDILVENSVLGAAELRADGTRGGDVSVTADDSGTDSVREITIATGEATGTKLIVARFGGTAGSGSGHGVL
ncbi:hypothetical protein LCGC14_2120170 [marine sediment metagenome]|uniref:Uncharacterized protein n=1 Tax=marine sediment metagenome TaxID=412755 RepID=A0A0F9E4H7_9ZZZZ